MHVFCLFCAHVFLVVDYVSVQLEMFVGVIGYSQKVIFAIWRTQVKVEIVNIIGDLVHQVLDLIKATN